MALLLLWILAISEPFPFGIKLSAILLRAIGKVNLIKIFKTLLLILNIQADDIKRIPGLEQVDFEDLTRPPWIYSLDTISKYCLSSIYELASSSLFHNYWISGRFNHGPQIILFYPMSMMVKNLTPAVCSGLFPTKNTKNTLSSC